MEFIIPPALNSNFDGYEFLSFVSLSSFATFNKVIKFNFSDNKSFDANLCSPFGALLEGLRKRNNLINVLNLPVNIKSDFIKNGFYKLINLGFQITESEITEMYFKRFTTLDTLSFQDYVKNKLLAQKGFPQSSDLLKKKIIKSILEIFNNAHTHGACEFVYTSGQYSTENMKLKFTISDMGYTIRKNVNDYFKSGSKISGEEAISWAVQEGNTTKQGKIPGGLGLSLIRDFLKLNQGSIQIISSNGYWEEKNGLIFETALKNRFLGTIVNFEFDLNDKKSYVMESEIDPKNVF